MTMAVMTGGSIELGSGDGGLADGVAVGSTAGVIGIGVALLVMLLFILLLIFLACKPWRFLSGFRSLPHRSSLKVPAPLHSISDSITFQPFSLIRMAPFGLLIDGSLAPASADALDWSGFWS